MLGSSEGGFGGQDAPDGFPASGRNVYQSGANPFFADERADWLRPDAGSIRLVKKGFLLMLRVLWLSLTFRLK